MIRSTKTTLRFANIGKLKKLNEFIDEYKRVVVAFVDMMWELDKVPQLAPKEITSKVSTWLSARSLQCAGKQASGIVRGTQIKQKRRAWQINKLHELGHHKKARKLQAIYNKVKQSKPHVDSLSCELDSRFVNIDLNNSTSFDGWLSLASLGNKIKLRLPFKKHEHFNEMLQKGNLKSICRLSKEEATFMFEVADPNQKTDGGILGIDIGQTTTLSCSDGQTLDKCPHGHTYASICGKLARKKKGSNNFQKTTTHRSNYLRYIVNKLCLTGVSVVNRESIKNFRKFTNTSRRLNHWNYKELFDVLDNKLAESGVLVLKLNPTYTSQRCSACGWTRKTNRKGKQFRCEKCSHEQDADLNAARNLGLNLLPVSKQERLQQKNRSGFYWDVASREPIVPSVQRTQVSCFS